MKIFCGKQPFFVLVFYLILFCQSADCQTITTFAGIGTSSSTCPSAGDGGPATSADFGDPYGVVSDASGNIYIADATCNSVRKIDPSGIITLIAGTGIGGYSGDGGLAINAQIQQPHGLAVDGAGNIYFADYYNNRIRKISITGIITTVAGNGVGTYAGDGGLAVNASIFHPYGVAVDALGNLYIADAANYRVRMVDANGIISTFAGTGTQGYTGNGGLAINADMNSPHDIAIDASGNVYIAEYANSVVRKIATNGIITAVAGTGIQGLSGDNGPAINAKMFFTNAIAFDGGGNLFIADASNHRIRKVSPSGIITTVAGTTSGYSGDGGPATSAKLFYPFDLAIDPSGNMYIADRYNYRVRKVNGFIDVQSLENPTDNIHVFPNPSTEVLFIEGIDTKCNLDILDCSGRVLMSLIDTSKSIDISFLSKGFYFLRIAGYQDQGVKMLKIAKE